MKAVAPKQLSSEMCQKLLQIAEKAMAQTFPKPHEGFAVALLTKKGNIYTGASYGSDTYTLTMHSEAVALAHASQHGEKDIVAITGPNCHICKQLIYESSIRSGIDTLVIIKEKKVIKQIPISTLLPYPWPEEPVI